MTNIENMLEKSVDFGMFSKEYFKYLYELLDSIDIDTINSFAKEMQEARDNRNMVFFVGNGGSAATASHMVNDFGTDIAKRTCTDKPFRVLSLTDNNAMMLAVANDSGYENLFVKQLELYYQPGDKLVAISASGNSPNVVAAAHWVKQRKGTVLSLVGFDGGKLKEISDVSVLVKAIKGEYGPVEDVHLILDHLVSYWLQNQILNKEAKK
jgi:D-sedoheptulose 7-phosphate isomerase